MAQHAPCVSAIGPSWGGPRGGRYRRRHDQGLRADGLGHRRALAPARRDEPAPRPLRVRSAPHQRLVTEAVGLIGVDAETLLAIGFVVREVPLPPSDL